MIGGRPDGSAAPLSRPPLTTPPPLQLAPGIRVSNHMCLGSITPCEEYRWGGACGPTMAVWAKFASCGDHNSYYWSASLLLFLYFSPSIPVYSIPISKEQIQHCSPITAERPPEHRGERREHTCTCKHRNHSSQPLDQGTLTAPHSPANQGRPGVLCSLVVW